MNFHGSTGERWRGSMLPNAPETNSQYFFIFYKPFCDPPFQRAHKSWFKCQTSFQFSKMFVGWNMPSFANQLSNLHFGFWLFNSFIGFLIHKSLGHLLFEISQENFSLKDTLAICFNSSRWPNILRPVPVRRRFLSYSVAWTPDCVFRPNRERTLMKYFTYHFS